VEYSHEDRIHRRPRCPISSNPVESPDRVALPAQLLLDCGYELVDFEPASIEISARVHGVHIDLVKKMGLYEPCRSGAGEPCCGRAGSGGRAGLSFAAPSRPPCSANRPGMCCFNSMAIAIRGSSLPPGGL